MSVHSLEIERQQILERMHARRDDYRRALLSGGDIDEVATGRHAVLESHVAGSRRAEIAGDEGDGAEGTGTQSTGT